MPVPKDVKKGYYTKNDLLKKLRQKGFFSNAWSLWKYTRDGILPKPKKTYTLKQGWKAGLYSEQEVAEIIAILSSLPVQKRIRVR